MSRQKRVLALFLSALMVLSVLGTGVAFAAQTVDNPSEIPDDQVFEVSNDGTVKGWERAAFTLRTDDTDAATAVPAPATVKGERIEGEPDDETVAGGDSGTQQKLIKRIGTDDERNKLGVHNTDDNIQIEFKDSWANSGELSDQEGVDLIAARLTPQENKGIPDTSSEAFDLFSSVQNANENASFTMIKEDSGPLTGGNLDATYSPSKAGNYIIFAAVNDKSGEDGFSVDGEKIKANDGAVIIGMDQLSIQEAPSTVTEPQNPNPDDGKLEFTVDAPDSFEAESGDGVTHAVAVYKESTFRESRFDVVVNGGNLGTDFSASDDMQLEHSINEINGVANVEDGTTINGYDLSDGRVARPVTATSIVDFLADEAGTEDPNTHPIEEGGEDSSSFETIDASVTVVNDRPAETTVTVEKKDFSSGEYRFVVLSTPDSDEQTMSTNTDTITLESESTTTPTPTPTPGDGDGDDDTGGGGGGGGGAPSSPSAEFDITNATINETVIESGDTIGVNVTIENTGDADGEFDARLTSRGVTLDQKSVDIDEGSSETVRLTNTFNESGAYNLQINNDYKLGLVFVDVEPAGVAVNETRQLADEAPDQPGLRVGFRNVSVTNITFSNENATGNVSVEDLTRVPRNITQPEGKAVQSSRITVPESERNRSATVQMRVNASRLNEFNASAEELVITRYNDTSEEWEELNTSVVSSDDESVLLEAETPGFSLFAVTAPDEEETTPTPTATPTDLTPTPTETDTTDDITTDTPEDTPTETDSETLPGFGAIVALIALLAAALLAMRRQ